MTDPTTHPAPRPDPYQGKPLQGFQLGASEAAEIVGLVDALIEAQFDVTAEPQRAAVEARIGRLCAIVEHSERFKAAYDRYVSRRWDETTGPEPTPNELGGLYAEQHSAMMSLFAALAARPDDGAEEGEADGR
jgi:hypothetical protein